ncbi:hypothetical protein GCM10011519_23700 [Marmoricola endophyticus]|uniref:YihY/virulence factor BrkB family protein n=1 Tax=Marmoricola endophyticus TaxID=2040280 RepID=A0A917BP92_9ACTN|nr:YihY/virulence factor BrkB family protein [Marmoricola endophyticus]GGF48959.1 hypothetical protein GCM10011519_23700 [Marmoricola endophyticus]
MAGVADSLDGFQRRHTVIGFPLAVTYKFFDDQSNYLAATITYYTFAAIFPLLLISSQILGFVLQGNPDLQKQVLDSTLSQFPIVGTQLGTPEGLSGSTVAVVIGSFTSLYGVLGLGQAAQNAIYVAWAVPRNSRPNPFLARLHSTWLFMLAGLVVIAVASLGSVAANADVFGVNFNVGVRVLFDLVAVVLIAAVFAVLTNVATPQRLGWLQLVPGALVTAVLWQVLQRGGSAYVTHVINRASDVNKVFALTLGLLALIYIAAVMAVIGVQINVVLAKRLWPRALLTPFTDSVELTDADKRAYTAYAKAQRHKGFERIRIFFDPSPREQERHGAEPEPKGWVEEARERTPQP